jgi:hypothetical protein
MAVTWPRARTPAKRPGVGVEGENKWLSLLWGGQERGWSELNARGVRILALGGLVLSLAMLYSGSLSFCTNEQLLPEPHCNLPDTFLYRSQFFWTFLLLLCIIALALTFRRPKTTRSGTAS